jgi:hypothetical protein
MALGRSTTFQPVSDRMLALLGQSQPHQELSGRLDYLHQLPTLWFRRLDLPSWRTDMSLVVTTTEGSNNLIASAWHISKQLSALLFDAGRNKRKY